MVRSRSKTTLHHHGCTDCHRRYTCGLEGCESDGLCNPCRSGVLSVLAIGWEPVDCCIANIPIREMTKDELRTYKLFGKPWFKCPTCHRQFPVQPDKVRKQVW